MDNFRRERRPKRRNPKVRYFTTSEVADMLGYHPNSVLYWIREGQLKAYRNQSGYFRILEDDMKRFIHEYFD